MGTVAVVLGGCRLHFDLFCMLPETLELGWGIGIGGREVLITCF
jgi:hypothetical protein